MCPNKYSSFAAILLAVLSACSSISQLRERPPDIFTTASGNFEFLAKCVANEADSLDIGVPVLRFDDAKKTARLFRVFENTGDAAFDIAFIQEGVNHVRVEGRGMPTINGRTGTFSRVWPAIQKCEKLGQSAGVP